MRGQKRS